ncbi:hypothetical protein ES703_61988 [subsurface metagenome]
MTTASTKENNTTRYPLKGRDGLTVPGSTRAIGDSSSIPFRGHPVSGAGSKSQRPCGGQGWDCPSPSLDYCDQVHKNETTTRDQRAKDRADYKQALVEALRVSGRGSDADQVAHCGEDFKVGKCLTCGASPAFPISCDHRLCPECAARRGAILISEHEDMLRQLRYPKMLTLTFLSVEHLDKAYVKWARNCFTRLRRRKVMASCWGGIYSFEATHSYKYGWHLHIHALIGSGYIDQGDLSREWLKVSGARIVDIRAVQGKAKWDGIREVVKYPAKAATFLGSPELVNEFLLATERVNLAYGFGAMYRVKTKRHAEAKMRCPVCGGSDISFRDGFGFCVPRIAVERVKGGYLWRPPPATTPDF